MVSHFGVPLEPEIVQYAHEEIAQPLRLLVIAAPQRAPFIIVYASKLAGYAIASYAQPIAGELQYNAVVVLS